MSRANKLIAYILLLIVAGVVSVFIYTETRDDLTYSLITNCEANIQNQLISPKTYELISAKVAESNLEKYDYKYLTDFSKKLIESDGYGAKHLFVIIDFYSKNRMNAEIKNTAYCDYTMIHKGDYSHKPNLSSVTVGNQTIDSKDDVVAWTLNAARVRSTKKTDIFFNKIKLIGKDVSKSTY